MGDSYLTLAEEVLRYKRTPLTAREILRNGDSMGVVPSHLHGKTPNKTLNARLSAHIRAEKERSRFYRTAPGTYFLSDFLRDPNVDAAYKRRFKGILRHKVVRKENVLSIPEAELRRMNICGFYPFSEEFFVNLLESYCNFCERKDAENRYDIKQFVSYTIIHKGNAILSYRRGAYSTVSAKLLGARSIGFGGHINELDFDLFSVGHLGIRQNVIREISEELYISPNTLQRASDDGSIKIKAFLNLDETDDARKHIAVVCLLNLDNFEYPKKRELSINDVGWIELSRAIENISEFELWSAHLIALFRSGDFQL